MEIEGCIMEEEITCHDCNCKEGEIHEFGCDVERCPFCGHQLIACGCSYKMLGYTNYGLLTEPYCGLLREVYENGLSEDELRRWERMLDKEGRVPYIRYPNVCCYCGKLWPDMFHVPNEEWKHYVEPIMRSKMLCRICYDGIKSKIDSKKYNPSSAL